MSQQNEQLIKIRHSAEHILTMAMRKFYPDMKMAMGPAIDEGFYFDVDLGDQKVTEADFGKIEKEMWRIINKKLPFEQQAVEIAEARKLFEGNPYKQEWLDEIEQKGEKATIYWTGKGIEDEFVDLCAGPHVGNSEEVKAFKLLSVAGAYWHGDEKNKMLTRIYGTAFGSKEELQKYLYMLEEAKKRDHRKLGQEMDLFSTSQLTGAGLILWHPKLSASRNIVEQFWKDEHTKRSYNLVYTPHIASMDMFTKTRHYIKYINSMFPVMMHQYIEGESKGDYTSDEQLKPMNCPNHVEIFKAAPKSYRDLPLRMAELGTVYRYERAGVLHGLTRVRGFTQDDSHIFCSPEQVIEEIRGVLQLTKFFYETFGFSDYQAYLATRPEKYLGTKDMWNFAEDSLRKAMELEDIEYKVDEGEGVFYGPKIDSKVKDSLGREWQLGTVQFDFNLPTYSESSEEDVEEFWQLKTFKDKFKTKENLAKYLKQLGRGLDVKFVDKDGQEKAVVMIHRTILGSMERFFGIIIEHYAGAFPVWLAPTQVVIVPISEKFDDYAQSLKKALVGGNIRVEVDNSNDSMQKRIREAEKQKVPYMLVVGEKEEQSSQVAVRARGRKDLGVMKLADFEKLIKEDIEQKKIW